MKKAYTEADIAELDRLHHLYHRKMLQGASLDRYPRLKDLSDLEVSILGLLSRKPEAMPKELAEELCISRSTLTSGLNRLEARGYLERRISPDDRRSFRLFLSEEGKAAQREHLSSEQDFYARALGLLDGKEEISAFLSLIAKITEGL